MVGTRRSDADWRQKSFLIQRLNITTSFAIAPPPTNGAPEPGALMLLGAGLAGFAAFRRRRTAS
jgi:hypothetical protein